MGIIMSYMKESNTPDPVTGLTPKEKAAIVSTWALVEQDRLGNGIELFKIFFTTKPEYQKYFKSFKDVPFDELPSNKHLKAHAISVMSALASLVSQLEHGDILVSMLQKIGENHKPRGIPAESFNVLNETVMTLLRKGLGSKFTKETEDAWGKLLKVAFTVVKDSFNRS